MSKVLTLKLSQTNCYLIQTAEGLCLIDCGNAGDQKSLVKAARKAGVELSEIRFLILTHHHSDHCGLLPFLKLCNPQLCVIMSRTCAHYMNTGSNVKQQLEAYTNKGLRLFMTAYIKLSRKFSEKLLPYEVCSQDILVEEDGAYPVCLPELLGFQLLLTPGHTPDSLSVIFGSLAFAGDAARNILNFTGTPYLPILTYDLYACYSSWDKLIKSGVQTIYPAHGKSFSVKRLKLPVSYYANQKKLISF